MKIKSYGNYYFRRGEQDPVCDYLRAARDRRPTKNAEYVRQGLADATARNLFDGKTRNPRFSTIMVIARAIGPEGVDAVARCLKYGGRRLKVVEGGGKKAARNGGAK